MLKTFWCFPPGRRLLGTCWSSRPRWAATPAPRSPPSLPGGWPRSCLWAMFDDLSKQLLRLSLDYSDKTATLVNFHMHNSHIFMIGDEGDLIYQMADGLPSRCRLGAQNILPLFIKHPKCQMLSYCCCIRCLVSKSKIKDKRFFYQTSLTCLA